MDLETSQRTDILFVKFWIILQRLHLLLFLLTEHTKEPPPSEVTRAICSMISLWASTIFHPQVLSPGGYHYMLPLTPSSQVRWYRERSDIGHSSDAGKKPTVWWEHTEKALWLETLILADIGLALDGTSLNSPAFCCLMNWLTNYSNWTFC